MAGEHLELRKWEGTRKDRGLFHCPKKIYEIVEVLMAAKYGQLWGECLIINPHNHIATL